MRRQATEDFIRIQLQDVKRGGVPIFAPRELVTGVVEIIPDREMSCRGVEIRMGWHTEGKGDRDEMTVDYDNAAVGRIAPDDPFIYPFQFELPDMPWSYEGQLIRIVWAIHVKIDVDAKLDVFNMMDVRTTREFMLRPS